MFNEHYGLETATLNGSKTRTSIIITVNNIYEKFIDCLNRDSEVEYEHDRFCARINQSLKVKYWMAIPSLPEN